MQSTSMQIRQHCTNNRVWMVQPHHSKREAGTVICGRDFRLTLPTSRQAFLDFLGPELLYLCIRKDQNSMILSIHSQIDFFKHKNITSFVKGLTWSMFVIEMNTFLLILCQTWKSRHILCQLHKCLLHKIVTQAIANVLVLDEVLEILPAKLYIPI